MNLKITKFYCNNQREKHGKENLSKSMQQIININMNKKVYNSQNYFYIFLLCKVTHISIGFLFLFIAFNSADNLAAKVMKDDGFNNIGFYSMSLLYLAFAIGSFFSTAIVNKIGVKCSLFIGAICYFFRIVCFLAPAYYNENPEWQEKTFVLRTGFIDAMILFSSAINGLGSGILWTSQGKYVSSCATDETKGFYFSFFCLIFMFSQIFGNLIAALVLRANGQPTYYIIMSVLSFVGAIIFLFLPIPKSRNTNLPENHESKIVVDVNSNDSNMINIVSDRDFMQQHLINTIENKQTEISNTNNQNTLSNQLAEELNLNMPIKQDQKQIQEENIQKPISKNNTFGQDIKATFFMLISAKMRKLIPLMIWSALSLATFAGSFVTMMTSTMEEFIIQ